MPEAEREKVPVKPNAFEPWASLPNARKYVATSVLEEALKCGAREFVVDLPMDAGIQILIDLKPENTTSSNCLIVSATQNYVPLSISDGTN